MVKYTSYTYDHRESETEKTNISEIVVAVTKHCMRELCHAHAHNQHVRDACRHRHTNPFARRTCCVGVSEDEARER